MRAVPDVIALSLPGVQDVQLDARVVLFTFALSGLIAIVFGLVPLMVSQRRDLTRSFTKLMSVETGIRAPRVLTMQVRLPQAGYDSGPAVRSFYQGRHDRVRTIPSARAASIQTDLPLASLL